jgi:emp24/gp25L/p24 family/GOLD
MIAVWLVCLFCSVAKGVYFYVSPSQEKCFKEDVPAKQVVLVKYKQFNNPGVPCFIVFKDKKGLPVSSQQLKTDTSEQGQAAYMNKDSGDLFVCVKCTGSRWSDGEPIKTEVRIDVGGEYMSEGDSAQKEDVDSVTVSLKKVLGKAAGVRAENEQVRKDERFFKVAHIDTNDKILALNIFAIGAVLICTFTQAMILRRYFKAEKLV